MASPKKAQTNKIPDYIARLTIVVDIPIPSRLVADYFEGTGHGPLSESEILAMGDSAVRDGIADWWAEKNALVYGLALGAEDTTIFSAKCEVREATRPQSPQSDDLEMAVVWAHWLSGSRYCRCGSAAINPGLYGRPPRIDLDLCDVCYWRRRAEEPSYVGRDWTRFSLLPDKKKKSQGDA